MARATFVKAAQKDIYTHGKNVKYKSEKGKRAGQELTKLDRTIPKDEKDTIFIAKGEPYYWWQFMHGNKNFSKEAPRQSQLTQSNYLSQLYSLQESLEDFAPETPEDLIEFVDNLKSDLESLKDECDSSLQNMPESLQSSPTGELLQERIDALDNAISEFDGLDLDYEELDEDDLKEEIAEENDIEIDDEDKWKEQITEEQLEEKKQEKAQEWLDEKLSEVQGISFE